MAVEIEFDDMQTKDGEPVASETAAEDQTVEEELDTTFTANGNVYEVKFTIGRVKLYEKSGHKPVMASIYQGGLFSLDELMSLIAYGTRPLGGAGYVSLKHGMAMAEKIIENNGYGAALRIVTGALERDCGFFFTVTS